MAFSLYAATIPSYQQILGSVSGLLVKAQTFCEEKAIKHQDILQARLAPDMLPFAYQVKSTAVHSLGAISLARCIGEAQDRCALHHLLLRLLRLLGDVPQSRAVQRSRTRRTEHRDAGGDFPSARKG